jgi:antitoxin MazE
MSTRVSRWGHSLAVRIPRALAHQAQLEEGAEVAIAVEGRRIVIAPAPAIYKIEDLVRGITDENCHAETDWGGPVGREVW